MKNELKLITDKTEYIATGAEQVINITNLEEEGVTDIFLTPDSISRYPIKSIDGEDITIDTLSLQNNSSKMFRLFGRVELPELEILDIPHEIQQDKIYVVKIMKGDWFYNSGISKYDLILRVTVGEYEEIYFEDGAMYFNGIVGETDEYFLYEFKLRKSDLPCGECKLSFKVGVFVDSQTQRYLCETPVETYNITPAEITEDFHEALYLDKSEFLFEAGQKYRLQIKSDVLLANTMVRISFNVSPVVYYEYSEIIDGNFIEFTMPNIDNLENGEVANFGFRASTKNSDGSVTDFDEHVACSGLYRFIYYNLQ